MDYTVIGALASAEGNRALTQTKVILQGVVQEIGDDLQNGTSIGPSLLRLKATYVSMGWNFDDNWNSLETECYPYKKYQAAPPIIKSDLVSKATSISGQSLNGGTVYLYYKDRDAVSMVCDGYNWTFDTEALQSGAPVQIYADVEGMTPSYFTSATVGYPGSGTEDDPYRIYTAEDLQGASNRGYYKLMNDIDLTQWINENSPTEGWPAIGRNSGEATYIDGDGHKVTGLWMNTTQNYNGLFSNFSAGQIKNLTVEVASGKKVKGGDYTGILIGRNANGRIVNCSVTGDVEGTIHVGGVAGYVEASTLNAVTFDGKASSVADNAWIGGVAGLLVNCTVTSCCSTVTINASGTERRAGGLAGTAKQGGSITKSLANVTMSATGTNNYVGGLIGYSEIPVSLSHSAGDVTATGSNSYTGGLVGYAKSSIENCYSTANVTGTQFTAGLVGYTFSSIDKCYAKGDVNGVTYGGGVVGELDGSTASISNSVACCNILSLTAQSSWGSRVVGGFKNGAAEPGNTNYALSTMQVSLNNVPQTKTDDSVEGRAKTEAELKTKSVYQTLGWDFNNVWKIDEGTGYPYLTDAPIVTPSDPTNPDPSGGDGPSSGNTLSISNVNGHVGDTFTLPVSLINEDEISAMQFELSLPDGVSVTSAALTDRKNDHTIGYKQAANGNYQFTVFSGASKAFSGNEGVVANISLSVSNSMAAGNYTIQLKNIELTTTAASGINPTDQSATLTVSNIKLGDVNGDDKISITDAVGIVNYILGSPSATFHPEAADVNGDSKISITDAVAVVNIILNQSAGVKERRTLETETEREPQ
ncbi:MAG: hypothetical protein K6F20_04780 [Bacteroidaceae bacterium]|nr:hypothetical protein [Bacteroidaceae bacterium]